MLIKNNVLSITTNFILAVINPVIIHFLVLVHPYFPHPQGVSDECSIPILSPRVWHFKSENVTNVGTRYDFHLSSTHPSLLKISLI